MESEGEIFLFFFCEERRIKKKVKKKADAS